ncbi:zinc-ribbon-domain-containing protein [Syncephalis plumigaleata]|nr:zinc-ribbon-domain-containing protein [Syncephalis plumigaleata]
MDVETQQLEEAYGEMLDQLETSTTSLSQMTTTTTTTTTVNGVTTTTTTTTSAPTAAVADTTTDSTGVASSSNQVAPTTEEEEDDEDEEEEEETATSSNEAADNSAVPPEINEEAQNELRRQILSIQNDSDIPPSEKAKRIQQLMSAGWEAARKREREERRKAAGIDETATEVELSGRIPDNAPPTQADLQPSFHNELQNIYGCKHYQRGVKLKANCCGRWFPCRFCHDDVCDHNIVRRDTKFMMCMRCKLVQPAAQDCANSDCGVRVARYYCDTCKLWDDNPSRSIYHCDKCGICRLGQGLGHDYFHCEKCNVCMAISLRGKHRCIERNLECDCPICGEYLFTSTSTVIFMRCGHCIHLKCHEQHLRTSYQCPTCWKSLADMTDYFARIDSVLGQQQMPQEYARFVSLVLCNDCERRGYAKFHFLYHKCAHCGSYNTKVLSTLQREEMDPSIPESSVDTPRYRGTGLSGSEEDDDDDDDENDEDVSNNESEDDEEEDEDEEEIEMDTSHTLEDEASLTETEDDPELD